MQMEMRRFLHDIIAEVLDLPKGSVIWANQDGVKQAVPLVTLQTYSHRAEAMEDRLTTDTPGIIDMKVPTEFVLAVRYFGAKKSYPVDILDDLVRHLEKPSVVDKCFSHGIAILYADPVQDITTLLDNYQQFEPAAAVDLHCRFTNAVSDDAGYIDTVEITGEYDPDGGPGGEGSEGSEGGTANGSLLIYGKIAQDGTVTDLEKAIPVNVSVSVADDDDKE
jgi:hypothetical protein